MDRLTLGGNIIETGTESCRPVGIRARAAAQGTVTG
ncbi:ATPase [Streptomyces canus]